MKRHEDTVLVLVGFTRAREFFSRIAEDRIITFPFMPDSKYKGYVKSFDVALAPAVTNPFNKSKSDIRIYEAGMAGLPVIASPVPYREAIHEYGVVAKNNSEWFRALRRFYQKPEEAKSLGQQHRQHTLEEHTYDVNIDKWIDLYKELV